MLLFPLSPRGSRKPFRLATELANSTIARVGARPPGDGGSTPGSRLTAEDAEIAAISSSSLARVRCLNKSARRIASALVDARPISQFGLEHGSPDGITIGREHPPDRGDEGKPDLCHF